MESDENPYKASQEQGTEPRHWWFVNEEGDLRARAVLLVLAVGSAVVVYWWWKGF